MGYIRLLGPGLGEEGPGSYKAMLRFLQGFLPLPPLHQKIEHVWRRGSLVRIADYTCKSPLTLEKKPDPAFWWRMAAVVVMSVGYLIMRGAFW